MELGVFLPISGRAAVHVLAEAAQQAEALGFDAVWTADRLVIPWEISTPYPYSLDARFIVPPDRPFLEPLTCLAFLAGRTQRIRLGMSVLVLPYRHPLYWAKIATTLDHLSRGRFILGIGAGWMEEEFAALGVPFAERGRITDEQLEVVARLWQDERAQFAGRYYRFDNLAFYPKPLQQPRIPLWVGGEAPAAQRRAGKYGDAWFPYFVRTTPQELAAKFANVRRAAEAAGRDPAQVRLCCCLPIELTPAPVTREEDRLVGSPAQLVEALQAYQAVGVHHLALQFMVPHWPERRAQIEQFAREVLPALRQA
ncbi:MAG: LLM class F420-dependent oxidoreductase [Candidatus Tectimicrobiota bacterium]|nr:MAG: LLM class F420-dependent oxidoreductase [Candidatus Tectomicrobia bacterium]